MSDNDTDDKKLSVNTRRPLGLRGGGGLSQGTVRQNFSHGRSKAVVVETRKRRIAKPGEAGAPAPEVRPQTSAPPREPSPELMREVLKERNSPQVAPVPPQSRAPEPTPAPATPATPVEPRVEAAAETVSAPEPRQEPVAEARVEAPAEPRVEARAEPQPAPVAPPAPEAPVAKAPEPRPQPPETRSVQEERPRPVEARVPPRPASSRFEPARPGAGPRRDGGRDGYRGAPPARDSRGPRPGAATRGADVTMGRLSRNEMDARRRALEEAASRDAEDRVRRDEESRRRAEETARRLAEIEGEERRRKEAEIRAEREAAATAQQLRTGARPRPAGDDRSAPARPAAGAPAAARPDARPLTARAFERKRPEEEKATKPKTGDDRRRTRLTLTNALEEDSNKRSPSLAALRRRQEKARRALESANREKIAREVQLPETITIQELAQRMSERSVEVIKFLMKQGQMMKPGDVIDADLAELIAAEFGHTVRRVSEADVETGLFTVADNAEAMVSRPPVVTIMGHVDHGKTSLLDAIRNANVVEGEAGGITQHIGAYQVEKNGSKITFIDTPGHEAFTSMRARGAQATDIAILVVAADDGVMPQTIESISHAKAAGVPIIVAINKIDKHEANPERVRNELLQREVFVETKGGDVLDVEVSAKTGLGLDKLLETILLQSEVLELKADPDRPAEGVVIEAELDKGRGAVATVLVKRGTLRPGDILIAGTEWGRVRALLNDRGEQLTEATPSMPVEVLGLSGTPMAGDMAAVVENEARAREIASYRTRLARDKVIARQSGTRGSLEQMMSQLQTSDLKEAAIVIKADVGGSAEAIVQALDKMGTTEVRARVIHSGVGGITESDVALAAASGAPILAFNVRANKQARDAAEREGIEIRYYSIIYDLVDDMKAVLSGLLAPERRETFLGYAQIRQVFNVSKVGKVAGCLVTEGRVERGVGVRLLRDNVVIHQGKLSTLKRFKDEVNEVQAGMECGMAFENYQDIREGDQIECFRVEMITRAL